MSSSSKPAMKPYSNLGRFFATSGGASCLPIPILKLFPGTLGTLPAVLLWWWLAEVLGWHFAVMAGITLTIFVLGMPLVNGVCQSIGVPDDGRVTFDEIGGYFAAMTIASWSFNASGVAWLFGIFGLFRYFDMVKPDPVWRFDREGMPKYSSPWIMLDDYVAGGLAGLFAWGFSAKASKVWVLFGIYAFLTLVCARLIPWLAYRGNSRPSLIKALRQPFRTWDPCNEKEVASS